MSSRVPAVLDAGLKEQQLSSSRVLLMAIENADLLAAACASTHIISCESEGEALEQLAEADGAIDLVVCAAPQADRARLLQAVRATDGAAQIALAVSRSERYQAFPFLCQGACAIVELPLDHQEIEAVAAQAAERRRLDREKQDQVAIGAALELADSPEALASIVSAWQRALDLDSVLLFVQSPGPQQNRLELVESRAHRCVPPALPWLEDYLGVHHLPAIVETPAPGIPPRETEEGPLLIAPVRLAQHAVGALVATRLSPPFGPADLERMRPLLSCTRLLLGVPQLKQTLMASDRLARLGQLTASVGHELRSPLAYVADNAAYLCEQLTLLVRRADARPEEKGNAANATLREMLHSAEESLDGSRRMRELLRDVSQFASADETTVVPLDLNESIRAAVRLTRADVRYRAQVICRLEGELPVSGNLPRLTQVFVNLIVNAAHALASYKKESEAHIVLLSRREGTRLIVEVSDNGPGIPASVMPRIFDAFYTTKAPGEGTGLGLFLCKDIARQHGGTLRVRSSPTRGATFTLDLPAAAPARAVDPIDAAIDLLSTAG